MDTSQNRRKRLRTSNTVFVKRLDKAITHHINESKKYLSKSHANLCMSTRTMQDVRRDVRVACEEITELSVECMNLSKRRPPFFAPPRRTSTSTTDSNIFERWEQLTNVSSKKDKRYTTLLQDKTLKPSTQILKDVPRTPSFGATHTINTQKLTNVLHAYNIHDPECSYVQGMNSIVSFLLSKTEDDEKVFWIFNQILGLPKYNLRQFYIPNMPQLHIACHQFNCILKQRLNRIFTHFTTIGIDSKDYLSSWYLSLFTAVPNIDVDLLSNIFDYYLDIGYIALISIALGILTVHEQKLLTMRHDEVLLFLKRDMWRNKKDEVIQDHQDQTESETKGKSGRLVKIDLNNLIAAASKPKVLEQRELDRMEIEYKMLNK